MIQWFLKSILFVMGYVYLLIDNFVKYPVGNIAGVYIDLDLQMRSRKRLCNHLEEKFGLEKDAFWKLPSTSKIRLGCQLGRNLGKGE
jgi:hypothetical protein